MCGPCRPRFDETRSRATTLVLQVDGRPVTANAGETVAAVLFAIGTRALSASGGRLRGYYCGMGTCHECLVEIDGRPLVRACTTPVADGMQVRTGAAPDRDPVSA